tara:strand:- start:891 stop:1250 length:360 start_codon:yes stop_codon:yes gene_type:complete
MAEYKKLKKVVGELKNASKMHLKQSKIINGHISDMKAPLAFKKHTMFSPEGKKMTADTYKEHLSLGKKGYEHSPAKHCGCGKSSSLKLKDNCYYKAKKAHKVFPSAYASGMIAKCRKNK